jgi:hypothetical protein
LRHIKKPKPHLRHGGFIPAIYPLPFDIQLIRTLTNLAARNIRMVAGYEGVLLSWPVIVFGCARTRS